MDRLAALPKVSEENKAGEKPPAHRRRAQSVDIEAASGASGDEESLSDSADYEDYDSEADDTVKSPTDRKPKSPDGKRPGVPKLAMGKIKVGIMDSYKSRSARPAFYNQQLLATESSDMTTKQGHILLHKNLQLKFLGDENEDLRNKVQNLEKMIKVNKEIMTTVLMQESAGNPVGGDASASTSLETQLSSQFKRQVELLEARNTKLEQDMEESNAQKLVLAQIIQNMKNQEDTANTAVQEHIKLLQDQLDRKEYTLQQNELKVYHYEKYLQRQGLLQQEARTLLNKFQLDGKGADQRVSNVVSENLLIKDQLKETVKDVNRIEKQFLRSKNIIAELKAKIEKMKKRHSDAQILANESPTITASERKMQKSNFDGERNLRKQGSSFFGAANELPSLRCSIIDGQDNMGAAADLGRVDWDEILVRESIPDDYGTIRPSETQREANEKMCDQNDNIVQNFD